MAQREPTAAQALFPHLPSGSPTEMEQRRASSLGEAMWPRPKPKPLNPYRESLLRHLKEANALAREGRKR
jgi:hypothetical protein